MPKRSLVNPIVFGFYGKLPINGDFIQRNLPSHFVHVWDQWVLEGLAACQQKYQDQWLDHYLTSPIWRFYLAPGTIDEKAYVGVIAPSVDSVGRYFPMSIVASLEPNVTPSFLSQSYQDFFTELEDIFLKYLHSEGAQVDGFIAELHVIGSKLEALISQESIDSLPDSYGGHRFKLRDQSDIASAASNLWLQELSRQQQNSTVWLSNGSSNFEPSMLTTRGLPNKEQFVSMLSSFDDTHWRTTNLTTAVYTQPIITAVEEIPISQPTPQDGEDQHSDNSKSNTAQLVNHTYDSQEEGHLLVGQQFDFRCSGFSDIGNTRKQNQDSIHIHQNQTLWVVADGMGGHSSGEIASQEITTQISQLSLHGDLDANINQIIGLLRGVNDKILNYARSENTTCGSTVVILVKSGDQCGFIWAGDSRCYVRRQGQLYQLTNDHAVAGSHAITKAVGVYDQLDPECGVHQLESGDRFLLCSDGLYGTLTDEQINYGLSFESPEEAQEHLKALVLSGEARDNLSGIFLWF